MKKLVCELCESTEFLKEDGKFICQGCGTQYSVEEAKKLMVEVQDGAIVVAEAEAPAAESQKIANLRKLAERAKEDNDSDMAAKYYEQLLMECPDDWEARFYSTYYAAHNIKIAQIGSAAAKVSNIIGPTLQMIKDTVDEGEHFCAYLSVATAVLEFSTMLFNNISSNMGSTREIMARNIDNWAVPTVTMLVIMADEMRLKFPDATTDQLAQSFYQTAYNYSVSFDGWSSSASTLHQNIVSRKTQIEAAIDEHENERLAAERQERIDAYWETHAEEKAALEAEKQELTEKAAALEAQSEVNERKNAAAIERLEKEKKELLPEEQAMQEQKRIVDGLNAERSNLGLFKGKQKKEIEARLQQVEEPKLAELKAAADQARKELNSRVDAQLTALRNESLEPGNLAKQHRERIAQIDDELTMDR